MKLSFYLRLAQSNILKNKKHYLPYMISSLAVIAIYFTMSSLVENIELYATFGIRTLSSVLQSGIVILDVFALIFLFYTNSFLFKKRKKELGLYNILGMEKRHLGCLIGVETILVSFMSMLSGLLAGALFYKLAELLLWKILHQPMITGFHFSLHALQSTLILFTAIFVLSFIYNLWQVGKVNALRLMSGSKQGEKEPKTKWLLTLIGIITLFGGYYLAQTVDFDVNAVLYFFPAVILVMIGTYCLFTAGSIAILKCLKKNKKFYYQSKHFTVISQMMYRMKQNAVGLANISILSTMVIVTLSTTIALYVGVDDLIKTRYPTDFAVSLYDHEASERIDLQEVEQMITQLAMDQQVELQDVCRRQMISDYAIIAGQAIHITEEDFPTGNLIRLYMSTSDILETQTPLAADEVLIYQLHQDQDLQDDLTINGQSFRIAGTLDEWLGNSLAQVSVESALFVVVKDEQALEKIYGRHLTADDWVTNYLFNLPDADMEAFYHALSDTLFGKEGEIGRYTGYIEVADQEDFMSMYGGLFFIGLFLGGVFIIATVLIIYYKQISEGYDDAERFKVMQKVGMSHSEIKRTIRTQILAVFFLPLLVACIHMIFAFRLIRIILAFMALTNTSLFMMACVGVVAIFAIFYTLVYVLTSRAYYQIVS